MREPLQTAQLIATHFREKQVALLSYHNPQTGNPSSFVTQGDLKWWLLTGQSFEQILSGGMSTGMILILVFSALIVVSASIAALRACWVAAHFLEIKEDGFPQTSAAQSYLQLQQLDVAVASSNLRNRHCKIRRCAGCEWFFVLRKQGCQLQLFWFCLNVWSTQNGRSRKMP